MDVGVKCHPSARFLVGEKGDGCDTKGLNDCAMGIGGFTSMILYRPMIDLKAFRNILGAPCPYVLISFSAMAGL